MKKLLISFVPILLATELAQACLVQGPLTDELKSKADLVFIGRAIAYTPPRLAQAGERGEGTPARIRFKIEKILRGSRKSEIEVSWINGTFGESKDLEAFLKTYGARSHVGVEHREKPWIVQGPCTPPYLWPAP